MVDPIAQLLIKWPHGVSSMTEYRVLDLRSGFLDIQPRIVKAFTPQDAGYLALGIELVEQGLASNLKANVYYQRASGQPFSVVQLYAKS